MVSTIRILTCYLDYSFDENYFKKIQEDYKPDIICLQRNNEIAANWINKNYFLEFGNDTAIAYDKNRFKLKAKAANTTNDYGWTFVSLLDKTTQKVYNLATVIFYEICENNKKFFEDFFASQKSQDLKNNIKKHINLFEIVYKYYFYNETYVESLHEFFSSTYTHKAVHFEKLTSTSSLDLRIKTYKFEEQTILAKILNFFKKNLKIYGFSFFYLFFSISFNLFF